MQHTSTLHELAEMFSMTAENIRLFAKKGIVVKDGRNNYNTVLSVKNYIKHLKNSGAAKGLDDPEAQVDLRQIKIEQEVENLKLTKAKREREEFKTAKLRSELIETEAAINLFSTMITSAKARLLSLPTKLAAQVRQSTSNGHAKQLLEKGLRQILEELAAQKIEFSVHSSEFTDD